MGYGPVRGRADYLELGTWNATCSMCGRKRKANTLVRNWQGLYRCPEHNEPRQPQDFVRAVPDNIGVPWAQDQEDSFTSLTATFPLSVFNAPLQLTLGAVPLTTELYLSLTDELGNILTTESTYIAQAILNIPSWVTPVSYQWSFVSGGAGIFIDSPTQSDTFFQTNSPGNSGVAKCVVTSSLGAVATVTFNVSS